MSEQKAPPAGEPRLHGHDWKHTCGPECAIYDRSLREARRICLKYGAPEGDGNMFITVAELAAELGSDEREDNAFTAGYDEGQRALREKYRAEFAAECERFHNEGHKCATCGRATPERGTK